MTVKFSKMSGNGNDFIIIDNRKGDNSLYNTTGFIEKVCARGLSVGADGIIFIENSDKADFKWQFFNSDGSVAEMCGNGARCAARYAYIEKIAGKSMTFETLAGIIEADIMDNDEVKAMLTIPHSLELDKTINACNSDYNIHSINTGVPHAVLIFDNIADVDLQGIGSSIRYNKDFAVNGTNVNFIQIIDNNNIKIRTYERGVEGETLACGTGCAASAIVAVQKGLVKSPVLMHTAGGKILTVYYNGEKVYLQGEGRLIYKGELNKEAYSY